MFETLTTLPSDAILGIMALFREDQSPGKIDLSVGVYQDENGRTPILECVRRGEQRLLESQQTKSYVAIAGNPGFNAGMEALLFGADHPALRDGRISTVQTPGGSGGLCVAAHLILRAQPDARVWLSDPSWPNHLPLLKLAGLTLEQYPYYDYENHRIDFDAMLEAFEKLGSGELVLLHGCCHNPSGADLSREQWQALVELFERRGIVWVPFARRSRSPARRMARSVVEMGLADPVTDEALAAVWAATRERALEGDVEAATVVIEVARRQRSDE